MSVDSPQSKAEALEWLRKRFSPDASRGLRANYVFDLGGEAGGRLVVRVDDGRLALALGGEVAADVTLRLSASDFYAVLAGRENPDMLLMADRLAIEGDLSLALKFRRLFASSR